MESFKQTLLGTENDGDVHLEMLDWSDEMNTPPSSPATKPSPISPRKSRPLSPLNGIVSRQMSHIKLCSEPGTPRSLLRKGKATFGRMDSVVNIHHCQSPPAPFSPKRRTTRPRFGVHKSSSLKQVLKSRYDAEFDEVCCLGSGEFGTVMQCRNKIDGAMYAIKKSHKSVELMGQRSRELLREVEAHAKLRPQRYIVRYYSAWHQDKHMYIQNEFCDGGALSTTFNKMARRKMFFTEKELIRILNHVVRGAKCMHDQQLVHLDIKLANIFLKTEYADEDEEMDRLDMVGGVDEEEAQHDVFLEEDVDDMKIEDDFQSSSPPPRDEVFRRLQEESTDVDEDDDDDEDIVRQLHDDVFSTPTKRAKLRRRATMRKVTIYKLGDLGLATSLKEPHIEEGDCHYMPRELLMNDRLDLDLRKVDIFSIGISMYELATLSPLPKNGPEWHRIRDDPVPLPEQYSREFQELLFAMMKNNPDERPSVAEILDSPLYSKKGTPKEKKLEDEIKSLKEKVKLLEKREREREQARILNMSTKPSPNLSRMKWDRKFSCNF
eukprot:m.17897 g.17897  ORF g.17897 m.17897 type:complete len:549 (-) comp4856_c0_seq1:413-2059(-)